MQYNLFSILKLTLIVNLKAKMFLLRIGKIFRNSVKQLINGISKVQCLKKNFAWNDQNLV